MKLSTNLLLCCFLLTASCAFSQQEISIGKKYSLQSLKLNEKREFCVYLPQDYYNNKISPAKYPVLYVLDGDAFFHSYTGIVQSLSKGPYQNIPQMIVVGILNTDRTRDLTPTAAGRTAFFDKQSTLYKNSGGNENFIRFLEMELRPFIDSSFRTNDYNILSGHSFGGLTAANILLNHTALFNAYIMIDPSLWWDDFVMLRQAGTIFPKKDFKQTNMYLAKAYKEIIVQDTTTDLPRSIDAFSNLLQQKQPKDLRWQFNYYQNEDHGTITMPAMYDGLKFIFKGHLVHIKKAVDKPEIVQQQFAALTRQLGATFLPSESWLNWMGDYCKGINKPETASYFYRLAGELYTTLKN